MYGVVKIFLKDKYSSILDRTGETLETEKQCAYNDLIAGDSFSECEFCLFKDGLDFYTDTTLCNRCVDLCVK